MIDSFHVGQRGAPSQIGFDHKQFTWWCLQPAPTLRDICVAEEDFTDAARRRDHIRNIAGKLTVLRV